MRAIQVFSSRLGVPAIVAVLLACSLGSAQAAVVFAETSTDALMNTVAGPAFTTHNFRVSQGGIYQATITDLDPSAALAMKITDVPVTTLSATVGTPGGVAFVDYIGAAAGSFAAVVKATSGSASSPGRGHQVRVALIPEPPIWVMLAAGFGLLGFVRIRRSAHDGI